MRGCHDYVWKIWITLCVPSNPLLLVLPPKITTFLIGTKNIREQENKREREEREEGRRGATEKEKNKEEKKRDQNPLHNTEA